MNLIIRQSSSFKRVVKKLTKPYKRILDEEIKKLSLDPHLGQLKKGDLDFLRVHKFKCFHQEYLLGYSYEESFLILTLIKIGVHENFYRDIKKL